MSTEGWVYAISTRNEFRSVTWSVITTGGRSSQDSGQKIPGSGKECRTLRPSSDNEIACEPLRVTAWWGVGSEEDGFGTRRVVV